MLNNVPIDELRVGPTGDHYFWPRHVLACRLRADKRRVMVGYRPEVDHRLNEAQLGVAGAASGAMTRAACQPLDVLKIRFQVSSTRVSWRVSLLYFNGTV